MKDKWGLIDMKFVQYGEIIDGGLNSLKSIIKELKKNLLKKKYIIEMKDTESYTPYASKIWDEKTKTKEFLCRYKRIDFEKELRHHSWKPKPQARKKQKKEVAESSIITTRSSEKAVQSNSRGRCFIVDDEDSSQATPAGNDTSSSKLAVQFELPETASKATTKLNIIGHHHCP